MRWNGGMLADKRVVSFPEELVGIIGGVDRTYIAEASAAIDIADTPLTPEQGPYLFAAGLGGPFAGVADGTGSTGFLYTSTVPTTAAPTNRSFTVETGDDFEVENAGYCKVTKIGIKGTQKGVCMMNGSAIMQPVARLGGGFSATSLITPNDLIFAGSRLYLDPVAGPIGTTLVQNQFLGFEINIEIMWIPKYTGEAATDTPAWTFAVYVGHKITGKLTLEHDTAVSGNAGIKALFRAQTPRLMRIDVLGQSYGTAGSGTLFTGGRRGFRADLPIKFTEIPPLEDLEGNDILTVSFESRYNSTYGSAGAFTFANEVSALP